MVEEINLSDEDVNLKTARKLKKEIIWEDPETLHQRFIYEKPIHQERPKKIFKKEYFWIVISDALHQNDSKSKRVKIFLKYIENLYLRLKISCRHW